MKKNWGFLFVFVALFLLQSVSNLLAQPSLRTFGAGQLQLDDGRGHTITLATPVPFINSWTLTLPSNPPIPGKYSVLWSDQTGVTNWVSDVELVGNALPNLMCPVNIATNATPGCNINIGNPNATINFQGPVVFSVAPSFPLLNHYMLKGDATNTQMPFAPGANGTYLGIVAGDPTWTSLPPAVSSITGTANQVLANGTSGIPQTGAVTLTTPQNINTGAIPTFAGMTLNGPLSITSGGATINGSVIANNGATINGTPLTVNAGETLNGLTGASANINILVTPTANGGTIATRTVSSLGFPSGNEPYLTFQADLGSLSNNRVLSTDATLTEVIGGSDNSNATIGINLANPNTWVGAQTFSTLTSTGNSSIGTSAGSNNGFGTGNGSTNTIGGVGGTTTMNGAVTFANAPTIPLAQNNMWVGNASNVQAPLPPIANSVLITSGAGNLVPTWGTTLPSGLTLPTATLTSPVITGGSINNTAIGASTPSTGAFTTLTSTGNSSIGSGNGTTNGFGTGSGSMNTIGGAGGTTTMNGAVTFANAPTIPLAQNNMWVGNASNVQAPLPPIANSVLITSGAGNLVPTWGTTLPSGLTIPNPSITGGSINNTTIGNVTPSTGSFTNLTGNGTMTQTGSTSINTTGAGSTTIGNNAGPSTTNINGNVGFGGNVTFTNAPTIPLANHNIWKGNASNNQQAYAAGADGTVLAVVSGDPTWTTAFGNTGTPTNINSTGAGNSVNINASPATGGTTILGNATSTTTMNGSVTFANAPTIPLAQNNMWVGNVSNVQAALPPIANSVLITSGASNLVPTWGTTLPSGLTLPTATLTSPIITGGSINNTTIGNVTPSTGSFTTLNSSSSSSIGTANSTTNNFGTGTGTTNTIGGAGGTTTMNGSVIFTNAPTIPLLKDYIWVGNASNVQAAVAPGFLGQVLTIVGTTPTWSSSIGGSGTAITISGTGAGNTTNIDASPATGGTTNIGNATSVTNLFGTVNFATAPTIPLAFHNIWKGNASGNQQAYAAGADGTVLGVVSGDPTWTTTLGNTSTPTNINSTGAGNSVNINASPASGGTTILGNATSTTTMNGAVTFTNAPTIPLTLNNMWVGNASNVQAALPPIANSVLITSGAGNVVPTWGTTLPSGLTLPTATLTSPSITGGSINNTTIGNVTPSTGSFTNLTGNGTMSQTGSASINTVGSGLTTIGNNAGPSTTNINGTVGFGGNVTFTNAPTIPLLKDYIWVGNGSNVQAAVAPGTVGQVLTIVGTTPTWSSSIGGSGTTIAISGTGAGNTTNIDASPASGGTNNIGNATSVTNLFGAVNFALAPTIPLAQNNMWVGNASNVQAALPPIANSVLITSGVGNVVPTWGTTLPSGLTLPTETLTSPTITGGSINNTTIGASTPSTGSFTTLTSSSSSSIGTGNSTTNNFGTGNSSTNTIGGTGGTTTMNGAVTFTNAPTIPLLKDYIWVGNGSNVQAAVAPGSVGQVLTIVGTTPTWSSSIGGSGTTIVISGTGAGNTTNIDASPASGGTNNIGNATSVTNLFGAVNFALAPTIPLAQNNMWVGNASNVQAALPPIANSVLITSGAGNVVPTWGTTLPSGLTLPTATLTSPSITGGSINNTTIGNVTPSTGSFTNLTGNGTMSQTGSTSINTVGSGLTTIGNNAGPSTTNINGTVGFGGNVTFTNAPTIPLAQNNMWVGNASNVQAALPPIANSVLITSGAGNVVPTWGTTLPSGLTLPTATLTSPVITGGSINNTTIGNVTPSTGSFTNLTGNGTMSQTGSTSINTTGTGSTTIGNNAGPSTTNINGTVGFGGNVTFTNAPTIPLAFHNIWKGNASGNQQAYAAGADGTILGVVSGDPTWTTTLGNTSTPTNINSTGAGNSVNINASPATGGATILGNATSTTTMNGAVTFTNAPTIPLTLNNMWVGNASNVQTALPPIANSVLITSGAGNLVPTWGTTLPSGLTLPTATLTSPTITGGSINNTTIGASTPSTGSFTTLNSSSSSSVGSGAGTSNGFGTGNGSSNNFGTGAGTANTIGGVGGLTTMNGAVTFTNAPTIPLTLNNMWVGNASNVQAALPPIANSVLITSGAGNLVPTWGTTLPSGLTLPNPTITGGSINNTTIGASTPSTGSFTTLNSSSSSSVGSGAGTSNGFGTGNGSSNSFGTGAGTANTIGGVGGLTTMNGAVTFTNAPTIPLTLNNMWVGNASNVQAALPPIANSVLITSGAGNLVPTWGTTLPSGLTLPNPTITGGSINNTTIGASTPSTGSFTTLTSSSSSSVGSGAGTSNGFGTGNGSSNSFGTGAGTANTIGGTGGLTTMNGAVTFTNAPTIPLTLNNMWVGNASNVQAALPPIANSVLITSGAGNLVPTWGTTLPSGLTLPNPTITGGSINNTTIGASTPSTGSFTTLNSSSSSSVGSGAGTSNGFGTGNGSANSFGTGTGTANTIGGTGGLTTMNGAVTFTNAPTIPLTKDYIWVGNGSNVQAAVAPGTVGQVLTIVGTTPTWSSSIGGSGTATTISGTGAGNTTNIDASPATGGTNNIGNATSVTNLFGTVNFGTAPTIPLAFHNIWKGNNSGNQQAYAAGADGTVLGIVSGDPTWTTTLGNTSTPTNINSTGAGNSVNINASPATGGATILGNATSTTTMNGAVTFTNAPTIPLTLNNMWVGNASNVQAALPPIANSVLITSGTGNVVPTWATTLPSALTIPSPSISGGSINNTTIGATTPSTGAFTNLTGNGTMSQTGSTSINTTGTGTTTIGNNAGPSTTNINGTVGFGGNVTFTNAPTIPLANHNIWKGNGSGVQQAYAAGADGTVLSVVSGDPTWTTTFGNTTTATNINSTGASNTVNINASPATGGTASIGNATSTTNLSGSLIHLNGSVATQASAGVFTSNTQVDALSGSPVTTLLPSSTNGLVVADASGKLLKTDSTFLSGAFVQYNVNAVQAKASPRTNNLFNIAYAASAPNGNAAGAVITSAALGANANATALTITASPTGTGLGKGIVITADSSIVANGSIIFEKELKVGATHDPGNIGMFLQSGGAGAATVWTTVSATALHWYAEDVAVPATYGLLAPVSTGNGSISHGGSASVTGNYSVVSGGRANTISGAGSTISGGGTDGTTNAPNNITSKSATIAGGMKNTVSGDYSTILGGRGLTLSGSGSVGYLGNNGGGTLDIAIAANNTAAFVNNDLWLANNDNTGHQMRFYSPQSGGATVTSNYSSIKAGVQGATINYTLPLTAAPSNGAYMTSTTGGQMSWSDSMSFSRISTGTNTSANLIVSTGATVTLGGTGIVESNKFKMNQTDASRTDAVDLGLASGTDEVAGVLPITHGGTGASTAAGALTALGIFRGQVAVSSVSNVTIISLAANSFTATAPITVTWEDPSGTMPDPFFNYKIKRNAVAGTITVTFSAIPPAGTFLNYMIINN